MLIRDFNPNDIWKRCRVCKDFHPKKDFPTAQKVCIDCAHNMNWKLKNN